MCTCVYVSRVCVCVCVCVCVYVGTPGVHPGGWVGVYGGRGARVGVCECWGGVCVRVCV